MKSFLKIAFAFLFLISFLLNTKRGVAFSVSSDQNVTPHLVTAPESIKSQKPFYVYVVLDLKPGWHVYWRVPGGAGFPPSIKWDLPEGWSAGVLEFSLPQQFTGPDGKAFNGYEHRALLRARITPEGDLKKKSSWKIKGTLSWLACDAGSCVPGSAILSVDLLQNSTTDVSSSAASVLASSSRSLHDSRLSHVVAPRSSSPAAISVRGLVSDRNEFLKVEKEFVPDDTFLKPHPISNQTEASSFPSSKSASWALFLALLSGMLGGFILNLMPCVLPVISLKIFGFLSQAGEDRAKVLRHGLAFVAGIYLWFGMLGALVLFLKAAGKEVTWAFQFQSPFFIIALSLLVFIFALHLFGVFELALPEKASSSLDRISSQTGYRGSFFQGLFATLLATPCTAPFLGSALGFAFTQSQGVILAMFAAIATGMAFPYLLLSAQPGWMKWLPRPGAWMERLKQLMAFPLLATNLWLLSILGVMRGLQSVLMMLLLLLVVGFSCWLYGSCPSTKPFLRYVTLSLSLFFLGIVSWSLIPKITTFSATNASFSQVPTTRETAAKEDKINWIPYSAARLEELRNAGKAVFIDFTAAWCLTCQFNERTAIETHAVKKLLHTKNIVSMKADWTNSNPQITEALRGFGRVGVPFYVFYPASQPGKKSEPVIFSELLTESELVKIFSTK